MKLSKTLISLFIAAAVIAITSHVARAEEPPPEESGSGKHLFILSGQSNMRSPLPESFKGVVEKVFGKEKVVVVTLAHPSQPIKRWYKNWAPPEGVAALEGKQNAAEQPNGAIYDDLLKLVERAIKGQKLASVTYIWMQGEADAGNGWGAVYEKSFFGVLDQFKSDLKLKDINYVLGRINDFWLTSKGVKDGDLMREIQVRIGEARPNGGWVNTDDLNTGVNPWGIYEFDGGHFPNASYQVMGQRFARKACQLIDPHVKLDEAIFDAVILDDARKVKGHLALGKPISGTKPDTKHSGGKLGLDALVDGKFGTADHNDPAWLGFPPTEKNIQFVIDLGKATDVTSVAVNVLIDHLGSAHLPSKIDVLISENGSDYRHLLSGRSESVSFSKHTREQNLSNDFKPQASLVFVERKAVPARYVKVEIVPDAASNSWLLLDEIIVNPVMK